MSLYTIAKYSEVKHTVFTKYTWISIGISFLLFLLTVICSHHFIQSQNLLYNLFFIVLMFFIIPNFLGIPFGRMPLKEYLITIKAGWLYSLFKHLLWGIVAVIILYAFISLVTLIYNSTIYTLNYAFIKWILIASQILWNELFFRGILLTTLQKNRRKYLAIFLNALISSLFPLIILFFFYPYTRLDIHALTLYVIWFFGMIFGMNIILGYLSIKTKNILPGILALLIVETMGVPITRYYWVFI